ncbi:MAG: hypothetical protein KAG14_03230, partial [Mycoplasmataceae bacterium]|nr:hypothetical protein [Mycoplasmataceae bacterium]
MVEKNAESLSLSVNTLPKIKLDGKYRSVGKVEVQNDDLKDFIETTATEAEKIKLSLDSSLDYSITLFNDKSFIIRADEKDEEILLLIQYDEAADEPEEKAKPINVLGRAPDVGLDLLPYLAKVVELNGSDLFITAGARVKAKVNSFAVDLDSFVLTPELTSAAAMGIMSDEQFKTFKETKDIDFAISMPDGSARFRVNAFYQRRTVGLVMRLIPSVI